MADATEKQNRLLALLDQLARIADRTKPFFRRATLLAGLCAVWLAWYAQQAAQMSTRGALVLGLVLLVPAMLLGWLWSLMSDLGELPVQARRALGGVQRFAGGAPAAAATGPAVTGPAVTGVLRMRGSLREAASLAWELEGVRGAIVGVLVLTNPLFLMILALAFGVALLEVLVAAITALIFVF